MDLGMHTVYYTEYFLACIFLCFVHMYFFDGFMQISKDEYPRYLSQKLVETKRHSLKREKLNPCKLKFFSWTKTHFYMNVNVVTLTICLPTHFPNVYVFYLLHSVTLHFIRFADMLSEHTHTEASAQRFVPVSLRPDWPSWAWSKLNVLFLSFWFSHMNHCFS